MKMESAKCDEIEEIDFRKEARSIIDDISFAVKSIALSEKLENSKDAVYINITTLEDNTFCIRLETDGLKVVGNAQDSCTNNINPKSYESIYSLLDTESVGYTQKFAEKLAGKLADLQN